MSQERSSWRARVYVGIALLLVVVAVLVWRSSRSPHVGPQGNAQVATESAARGDRFERVTGGDQDPNADPAELLHELRGRVIDVQRRPIPDAEVELLYRPAGWVELQAGVATKPTRTDANGEFVIPKLRAGDYRLEARKDDAVSATVEVQLSARTAPVTLILVPGATLIVRVVSAQNDQPIAGALVRVAPGNSELGPVDTRREARTDTLGVARIAGINPVGNHGVYAEAPGYAGAAVNVLAGANPDRAGWNAVLRLRPGGTVTGRVLDAHGQPVAGAVMQWYSGAAAIDADRASGVLSSHQGILNLGAARSGPDGRFRLSAPGGAGLLEAKHPSHRPGFARGVVPVVGELALDVTIEDGARLAGVVLDATGNPVPGANVIVTKRGISHQQMFMDAYRFRATTDRYGEFAFVGLEREELSLAAWNRDGSSELADVDLRSGVDQTGVVLELMRTGRISGVVAEADGAPVPFAQVVFFVLSQSVTPPSGVTADSHQSALIANPRSQGVVVAGEDGRFVITGLVDGEYQLEARRTSALSVAPVFGAGHKGNVRPGQEVTLTLPALGSISGRAVGDDGMPIPGATVAAALWQGQGNTSYPPGRLIGGDGRFKLTEVPAGSYGVNVSGANLVDASTSEFEVVGGKNTDVGTIRVSRGVARTGIVVDKSGAPLEGVHVAIQVGADAGKIVEDTTDDRGAFEVRPLPPTTPIRVRAYTREVTSDWQTVAPGVTNIKIVLAAGTTGNVAGLVVQDGQSVEKRLVMLTLDTAEGANANPSLLKNRANTVSEAGGRFQFKDVATGQYRLWVRRAGDRGPEWTAHAEPVVIQPGKEVFVVFQIPDAR